MLTLALTAVLALAPQDPPKPKPPSPERIEAAVEALEKAFDGKELPPKLAAIADARDVLDEDVIEALAKGVREDEREVKQAVLEALRWMDHPRALEELHELYERDEELVEDAELLPVLLKAIGQHGNEESIELLADDPFKTKSPEAVAARMLGLGRIREERSVEELFGMLQKVGRGKALGSMDEFRLAMMALTGVDAGPSRDAWIAWWNDNKRSVEVPKEMPLLPEEAQRRWDRYWGEEHRESRPERREDRGGDE